MKRMLCRSTQRASYTYLLFPLLRMHRWFDRLPGRRVNEMAEFEIHPLINRVLRVVMGAENRLSRAGFRTPFCGSLVVVASKGSLTPMTRPERKTVTDFSSFRRAPMRLRSLCAVIVLACVLGCSSGGSEGEPPPGSGAFGQLPGSDIHADGWIGEEATIFVANPHRNPGLLIEGENVETGADNESTWLHVMFDGGQDSVYITRTGTFRSYFRIPADLAQADTLRFQVKLSKTFVPARIGTSSDERLLSVRLLRVMAVSEKRLESRLTATLSFPFDVEEDPNVNGIYSDGWISDQAEVVLHGTQGRTRLMMRGYIPAGVSPNIRIEVLGMEIANQLLPRQESGMFSAEFALPEEAVDADRLSLKLRPGSTYVPEERGLNEDTRTLSYKLSYLGVQ
jgi:hypothetical protein